MVKTPVKADEEIIKIAKEQLNLEETDEKAIDIADRDEKKSISYLTKLLKENSIEVNDENIFIVASCKEKGLAFLKGEAKVNIRKIENLKENKIKENDDFEKYTVNVNGEIFNISIKEGERSKISNKK